MSQLRKSAIVAVTLSTLVLITGCPQPAPPPPEAVLAGTWQLTPAPTGISQYFITFNSAGEVTQVSYVYTDPITNLSVQVDIGDTSFIESSSTVDGSDVTISATWLAVNNLVFDGALNDAQDQITGTATYVVVVGNVQVSFPASNAQLTKQ